MINPIKERHSNFYKVSIFIQNQICAILVFKETKIEEKKESDTEQTIDTTTIPSLFVVFQRH